MTATIPADVDYRFGEAITRGDLDAALACYEDEASLVPQPGQIVRGAALREAVAGLIALRGPLDITVEEVVEAGDVALLRSRWTLRGTGDDGQPVALAGAGAEVVRRQPDGTWRFVIDHPFAASAPAGA
jgi:ketosteroid isomerase-like protein